MASGEQLKAFLQEQLGVVRGEAGVAREAQQAAGMDPVPGSARPNRYGVYWVLEVQT